MLTSLRIRQFKAWHDTGLVRLAPLTVFFGEHGSGKSSLGQALALLRQHADASLPADSPSVPASAPQVEVGWQGGGSRHTWSSQTPDREAAASLRDGLSFVGAVQAAPVSRQGTSHAVNATTLHWLTAMGLTPSLAPEHAEADASPSTLHAQHLLDQIFSAPQDGTVWLEHPEGHLHPKAQAVLMDAFIATVLAREGGRPRGVQCILESHSEAFLNRLQRRVAEGVIAPDDVALYICRQQGRHAELEALRHNAYGDIENWPNDLFGHDMSDIAARTLATLRRRQGPPSTGSPT